MANSRNKLEEAQYFLGKMYEIQQMFGRVYEPAYSEQRKQFTFNLNAFLSAFRAVRQNVLLTDYAGRQNSAGGGFQQWLEVEFEALRCANSDLDFLTEARHVSVHEKNLEPKARFTATIRTCEPYVMRNPIITNAEGVSRHSDASAVSSEELEGLKKSAVAVEPPTSPSPPKPTVVYYFDKLGPNPARRANKGPIPDPPTEDVLTVCTTQLGILEKFVARCEREFS